MKKLVAEYGKLPGSFNAVAPILVPIILMALGSIASMAGLTGTANDILQFFGTPIIALAVGTIFAIVQLSGAGKMADFYDITNETLKTVGPILFVTAAGGVLGKVISSTDMINYITQNAALLEKIGIFFPFILAANPENSTGIFYSCNHNNCRYCSSDPYCSRTWNTGSYRSGSYGYRRREQ